ncbi:MAG: YifB family Mg chelatase-like AAA ATPase, partial [Rhabdochlamydiaceae bacterium]
SQIVRNRVQKARNKQNNRYQGTSITSNAELTNKTIKTYCKLTDECINLLRQAVATMGLSGRAYYRIIKLSRTIADLADEETIQPNHITEALQYRPKGELY